MRTARRGDGGPARVRSIRTTPRTRGERSALEAEVAELAVAVLLDERDLALLAALVGDGGGGVVAVHAHVVDLGVAHVLQRVTRQGQHQADRLLAALLALPERLA